MYNVLIIMNKVKYNRNGNTAVIQCIYNGENIQCHLQT